MRYANYSIEEIDAIIENSKKRMAAIKLTDDCSKSNIEAKTKFINYTLKKIESFEELKSRKVLLSALNNESEEYVRTYIEKYLERYLINRDILINIDRILILLDNVYLAADYKEKIAFYLARNYVNIPSNNKYAESERLLDRLGIHDRKIFYSEIAQQGNLEYFYNFIIKSDSSFSDLSLFDNFELNESDYSNPLLLRIYKEAFFRKSNYKLQKYVMRMVKSSVKGCGKLNDLYYNSLLEIPNLRKEFIADLYSLIDGYSSDKDILSIFYLLSKERKNIIKRIILEEKLYRSASIYLKYYSYDPNMLKLLILDNKYDIISDIAISTHGKKTKVFDMCDLAMTNCENPMIIMDYISKISSPREKILVKLIINSNNHQALVRLWERKCEDDTLCISKDQLATYIIKKGPIETNNYIKAKYPKYQELFNKAFCRSLIKTDSNK